MSPFRHAPPQGRGGDTQVNDDEIKAKTVAKLHRKGYYSPQGMALETAAGLGIPTEKIGRAKELLRDMAQSDDAPVVWKPSSGREAVCLSPDGGSDRVAAWIRRHDPDALPWDLK